ncbi:hypothetical protein Cfor_11477 [Coptotermes formosanus]|uniref:Transmembrane protein 126A n=1 Tax=Coptotermes formosanus TaxID=36987 RepID=A0A6L2PW65_COPFO|nr:hypothetical protein Cfor_11477 [Coptotermes formosanus]
MALYRGKRSEMPEGGMYLTKQEAKEYQYRVLFGWEPQRDVWPFRYGFGILSACSALSGLYINSYFRNRLRLHSYGRVSSYLPLVVLPSIMSALFHHEAVTTNVILQDVCPLCLELRASAIQVGCSVMYPALLSPLVGFALASYYNSYKVPLVTDDPKGVFALWRKLIKQTRYTLISIGIVQAFVAMWLTHCEIKSFYKVQAKLHAESSKTEELKN